MTKPLITLEEHNSLSNLLQNQKIQILLLIESPHYSKCPRCRHYTKDGMNNFDNLCDRCVNVLIDNFPEHESVNHIKNKTPQQPEYWSNIWEKRKNLLNTKEPSSIYQRFCDILPKEVLETPEYFLGKNYKTIFDFWECIDNFTIQEWKLIDEKYSKLDKEFVTESEDVILKQIKGAAWWASYESVELSIPDNSLKGAKKASCLATGELIKMPKMRAVTPDFLPLFL